MSGQSSEVGVPDLSRELTVARDVVEGYRRDGFAVIRGAATRAEIEPFRPWIAAQWSEHKLDRRPMAERDVYGQAFTQALNLGNHDGRIRALSRARRFARLAADLMGVRGVRVFLDEAFFKEPGSGTTPWHQDQSTFPFHAERAMTLWIPLMRVERRHGMLSFAVGSHRDGSYGPPDISAETDKAFAARVVERGYPVYDCGPMEPGDVSAHDGWTVHRAGRNETGETREVYSIHYFADGARVFQPDNPSRERILKLFGPSLAPGDLAASEAWPLVYSADDPTHGA